MSADIVPFDWVPATSIARPNVFLPCEYRIKLATERWEHREAATLRRQVFCTEQDLFKHDDRDAVDDRAQTLVALSCISGTAEAVVGTVRIHTTTDSPDCTHWQGSRLAVQREYRGIAWLGSELIRLAVGTAHARGAQCFTALVQVQNVALFRRLHWQSLEERQLLGRPHHLMQASLAHYPPCFDAEQGFITTLRQAA